MTAKMVLPPGKPVFHQGLAAPPKHRMPLGSRHHLS
jgi:hypothetical protein